MKFRITKAKAAFNKHSFFTSKLHLHLKNKPERTTVSAYLREVLKLGYFGKYIRNTWKFLKCVVLEKDGEDQFDRSCEK